MAESKGPGFLRGLEFGDVAELEDHGALRSTQVEQHLIRNRENAGSSPAVSAVIT